MRAVRDGSVEIVARCLPRDGLTHAAPRLAAPGEDTEEIELDMGAGSAQMDPT